MALTLKQQKALDFHLSGLSKDESVRRAGYAESSMGKDIFASPAIKAELEARRRLAARRHKIDEDWVVQRLAAIANANIGDLIKFNEDGDPYMDLTCMDDDMRVALSDFQVEQYKQGRGKAAKAVKKFRVKANDKLRALEMLARYLGLFNDKITIQGELSLADRLDRARDRVLDGPSV